MPLSSSFLITSLARASSFSESSLILVPALIVMLLVIGASSGAAGLGGGATRRWGKSAGGRGEGTPPVAAAPARGCGRAAVGCCGRGSLPRWTWGRGGTPLGTETPG